MTKRNNAHASGGHPAYTYVRPTPARKTPEAIEKFLQGLREGWSASGAARIAGVGRSTVYHWREEDEEFAAAWDDAVEEGTDRLEDEARRRAEEGNTKGVYYQGDRVDDEVVYSDTLMVKMLEGRRPSKYGRRVEHSGPNGGSIPIHTVKRIVVDSKGEK